MSEESFFNFEPRSDDIKKKISEERKKMNEPLGKYANNDIVKSTTGEDIFNFEKNKQKLIDDLNWLKSLKVEEFTFRKKFEEIQLVNDFIKKYDTRAKARIWEPTNINDEELTIKEINILQPKVIVVVDEFQERLWTTLRIYCSTAEYNQAPGRFIKFLMIDNISNQVLGIASIASDVISISARDKFIGWTSEDKLQHKMLKYSAIGTTIVPTQPLGINFLGGKLIAALVTSDVVRNEWENEDLDKTKSKPCKLVGMTTTSLYGRPSMYDAMKWWKGVGLSKGKIPIKPYEDVYKDWHDWLKQYKKEKYDEAMKQKEGVSGPVTGAKMRVLSMIFDACDIKQSEYCHGYERGVYYSCFYENTKEFLCRKITENKLVMKPLFKDGVKAILEWWRPKAIQRYKKLKAEGRLNPNTLFYNEMDRNIVYPSMTDKEAYNEVKKKFFIDVGR
jgi:hypothetical protein